MIRTRQGTMALIRNPDERKLSSSDVQNVVETLVADPNGRLLLTVLDRMGDQADAETLIDSVVAAFRNANIQVDSGLLRNRLRGLQRGRLVEFKDRERVALTNLGRRVSSRLDP